MGMLDRKALLAKEKLQIEKVDLGGEDFVYVRAMTGRERDIFEQSLVKEKKDEEGKIIGFDNAMQDFRAKLCVCCVCDENGNNTLNPEDFPILSQHMSAKRLEVIVNQAQELNKISKKDKENLLKNLKAVQDGNSNLGSAEN
jgi:hypothetical protein